MNYQIGTSLETLQSLTDLEIGLPKASPVDYPEYITLGNGHDRGIGSLQCVWRYSYLTQDELNILRTLFPLTSNDCYLQTLARNGEYKTYSGLIKFIEPENPKADYFLDYVIYFTCLVEVTP